MIAEYDDEMDEMKKPGSFLNSFTVYYENKSFLI